jgi:hypothetical protein
MKLRQTLKEDPKAFIFVFGPIPPGRRIDRQRKIYVFERQ